jgi:hypothetical protein
LFCRAYVSNQTKLWTVQKVTADHEHLRLQFLAHMRYNCLSHIVFTDET